MAEAAIHGPVVYFGPVRRLGRVLKRRHAHRMTKGDLHSFVRRMMLGCAWNLHPSEICQERMPGVNTAHNLRTGIIKVCFVQNPAQ